MISSYVKYSSIDCTIVRGIINFFLPYIITSEEYGTTEARRWRKTHWLARRTREVVAAEAASSAESPCGPWSRSCRPVGESPLATAAAETVGPEGTLPQEESTDYTVGECPVWSASRKCRLYTGRTRTVCSAGRGRGRAPVAASGFGYGCRQNASRIRAECGSRVYALQCGKLSLSSHYSGNKSIRWWAIHLHNTLWSPRTGQTF